MVRSYTTCAASSDVEHRDSFISNGFMDKKNPNSPSNNTKTAGELLRKQAARF